MLGPEDLSHNEMAEIMSDVLGTPIRYQQIPIDAFRQQLAERGMSDAMVNGMVEMMVAKDQGLDNAEPRTPQSTTPDQLSPVVCRGAPSDCRPGAAHQP